MLSLCLSLFTHTEQHTRSHTGHVMVRANKSLRRSTCIQNLYFASTKAPKAAKQTYKEAKPSRNRNTVKLCIPICVSMLAVASRCRFIYIQHCMGARGEEYGKPTDAVNSSDGKSETGDIQAGTKMAD